MPDDFSEVAELKLDIEEAQTLMASANRKRWRDIFSIELLKLETKLNNLQVESDAKRSVTNSATSTSVTSGSTKIYATIIRNYSWDQSEKFLKIYLTLNGVQNLNKENITCNFGNQSLLFRALKLDGKNHELNIAVLAYPILPDKSYFKVKSDMVVVFAAKAQQNITWETITAEEKRVLDQKKSQKPDPAGKDPTAGLMDLMKQMYDDGDDDMKRMLNKTWYESQQKTGKGPTELPDMGDMSI